MASSRICTQDDPIWDIIRAKCLGSRKSQEQQGIPNTRSLSQHRSEDHKTLLDENCVTREYSPRSDRSTASQASALTVIISAWATKVHPRAHDFFQSHERMIEVLRSIALRIHREDDPILGSDKCVKWHGDSAQDERDARVRHAQMRLIKPNETEPSDAFVSRVLVFFFATNESFELLMQLPKQPFRMLCGDQLCINLHHIAGEID
ncbi:hypothetical protein FOL47_005480 [Perkinsus chesapeaki]|uniref:Uncharacterized protein n=1 Tax=Perkinsus chesapeaki TaxID=330153 RepID=A0A7J6LYQ6_PERCH|nr:hypothetical protein FOL47_005480 [Perkinsus chesapeaki]